MNIQSFEDIIKIQPKGLLTIPSKLRKSLGFEENNLVRMIVDRGRIILEPVCTIPYPVRTYSQSDIDEFIALDTEESSVLKKKKLIP